MTLLNRTVTAAVTIARPRDEVFAFVHDFANLPTYLGDVAAVRETGSGRYTWTVTGPLGLRLPMRVVVDKVQAPSLMMYRTAGPTAARWRLSFDAVGPARTRVVEELAGPFAPPVSWLLAAAGKHPRGEVTDNLQRLKEVLETGSVYTTTHAARGKFTDGGKQ